jgi:hypothetical protein
LDRFPTDAIKQSQAFQSVSDAKNFNNGLYGTLRGRLYGTFYYVSDIQADILNATLDYGYYYGAIYNWNFAASDLQIKNTWADYYSALRDINVFLDHVDAIPVATPEEQAQINTYKGEALLARAYYYHQLAKRYAKDYEPATAATDFGLPIVLHYDITEKPVRSSLEDVYIRILTDIKDAKPLLTTAGAPGSIYLTKDAITALESQVYLHIHKYPEAVTAANTLIDSNVYPLASTKDDLKKVWYNDDSAESIVQLYGERPSELPNAVNIYLDRYNATTKKYSPSYIPQQWVVDLYDDADFRKEIYLEKKPVVLGTFDYSDIYLITKFPGNSIFNSSTTTSVYQHKPKLFRIAEIHLIKAEALYQSNDAPGAVNALNELRIKRGLSALPAGLTGTALFDEIKAERTRELLAEGTRLDDLKRWHLGVKRQQSQNNNVVALGENENGLERPAEHYRLVWPIPDNDLQANPNLKGKQNQGYE